MQLHKIMKKFLKHLPNTEFDNFSDTTIFVVII